MPNEVSGGETFEEGIGNANEKQQLNNVSSAIATLSALAAATHLFGPVRCPSAWHECFGAFHLGKACPRTAASSSSLSSSPSLSNPLFFSQFACQTALLNWQSPFMAAPSNCVPNTVLSTELYVPAIFECALVIFMAN